jgi:lysophospholipase L1-like esterase
MYKIIFILLLAFPDSFLHAQDTLKYDFVNGNILTVLGRAANVNPNSFHRIDSADQKKLPARVAELANNSAGISISFQTNSKRIKVNWVLAKYINLWNMTPVAINGLDMYGWKNNHWQYVASAKPLSDTNSAVIVSNLDGAMHTFRIYLPLYAELKTIEIGVDAGSIIKKAGNKFVPQKKVVIYGSSITQGASASRPGMAYPSIISRNLNLETFNLGFSGTGKMEIEMADILGKMDADVYILDCVPNPSPKQIRERAVPFIKRLRQLKPTVPVILVESIFREDGNWDTVKGNYVTNQNKEFRQAYEQLIAEKFENLYYISNSDLIGNDHEATVDGTHFTDLGFTRFAKHIEDALVKILRK